MIADTKPQTVVLDAIEGNDPDAYDMAVSRGHELTARKSAAKVELGLIALALTERPSIYGARILERYAKDIGCSTPTLRNYRQVARWFGESLDGDPFDATPLRFGHWLAASRVAEHWLSEGESKGEAFVQAQRFITEAEDLAWSVDQANVEASKIAGRDVPGETIIEGSARVERISGTQVTLSLTAESAARLIAGADVDVIIRKAKAAK